MVTYLNACCIKKILILYQRKKKYKWIFLSSFLVSIMYEDAYRDLFLMVLPLIWLYFFFFERNCLYFIMIFYRSSICTILSKFIADHKKGHLEALFNLLQKLPPRCGPYISQISSQLQHCLIENESFRGVGRDNTVRYVWK